MDREEVEVDLYDAVCLDDSTVADVPRRVARQLLGAGVDMPLIAVAYRGRIPSQQRRTTRSFIGAAPHLGYLAGAMRAAVELLDDRARAMYVSAYDQAYAAVRARPTDGDQTRRDGHR